MKTRRLIALILAAVMVFGISVPTFAKTKNENLGAILDKIQDSFDDAMENLKKGDEEFFKAIGEDYASYVENSDKVPEWLGTIRETCSGLYDAINEETVNYFKTVVEELDLTNYSDWSDARDDLYDLVYKDIFDDLYDDVYDGYIENIYDDIYDEILEKQPDDVEYEEWWNTKNALYNVYYAARDDFYDDMNYAREEFYDMYSSIGDAFYEEEYDVEAILSDELNEDLDKIVTAIEKDFADTEKKIKEEMAAVVKDLGSTAESFEENYSKLEDWYELTLTESRDLYDRAEEACIDFYKTTVDTVGLEKEWDWKRVTQILYRKMYLKAYPNYMKAIYRDLFQELYDQVYVGLFEPIYDTTDYDKWYDLRSNFYDDWYDAKSDFYDDCYDAKSDFYDDWSDVRSAFYKGDTDINDILRIKEKDAA